MSRAIGENQRGCLTMLVEFGPWRRDSRFMWDTPSRTFRVMVSLANRGLARANKDGEFEITNAGREVLAG